MGFFNKKEEILEIKLTSFGKHLLSCGKFKPVYYKYFDNDILYDAAYADFSESSGVSEARIQQNTPSLKLQTSYNDLEQSVRKFRPAIMSPTGEPTNYELMMYDLAFFEEEYNAASAMLPLGNSDPANQNIPAWKIVELKGGIDKITAYSNIFNDKAAVATIRINDISGIDGSGVSSVQLISTNGDTHVFIQTPTNNSANILNPNGTPGTWGYESGVTDAHKAAENIAFVINSHADFSAESYENVVTITQSTIGLAGNTVVTLINFHGSDTKTDFSGGATEGDLDTVSSPTINTPLIVSEVTASIRHKNADFCGPVDPKTQKYVHVYGDNTFLAVDDDFILMKVEETNVPLAQEAFKVEVFMEELDENDNIILVPKLFKKKIEYVKDDILLSSEEIEEQMRQNSLEVDSKYVEYWLDIRVDNKIDNKTRCEYIVALESKGNIFDNNIDCDQFNQQPGSNLYEPDDFEPEECG
tara:strand:+ start:1738 stop:3153 length:1416 start_codon:yes stop_codon:yes gene_type:complete